MIMEYTPLTLWDRLLRLIVWGVIILLPLFIYALWAPEILAHAKLMKEKLHLEKKLEADLKRKDILEEQLQRLRGDPKYIEQIAREELGLVRAGESIIFFFKKDNNNDKLNNF